MTTRARALACLLLAAASPAGAVAPRTEAGLRMGWLRTTGAVRGLAAGAPVPEVYMTVSRPGSPLSLEFSMSGYDVSGSESGRALYTSGSVAAPTAFVFSQDLVALPILGTLRVDRRRPRWDLHAGVGLGMVVTTLTRRLSFSDPNAEAAFGQTSASYDTDAEVHAQAGADWDIGRGWSAGAFLRWAYARSGVRIYRGFQAANASGAFFNEGPPAGDAYGTFLSLSLRRRF